MPEKEPECGDPIGLPDWLKIVPLEAVASSERLGWVGLEAARHRASPAFELKQPALTHHVLVLFARPPEELDVRYEGVKRHVPPPAGSVPLIVVNEPPMANGAPRSAVRALMASAFSAVLTTSVPGVTTWVPKLVPELRSLKMPT